MWNCEFFWLLPDSSSGISIFVCPETKSLNYSDIEKECNLALADKIKPTDIEKLSKQKMFLPTSIMDLVWMVQNFHAVITLCFGPQSHSSRCLKEWTNHIYDNHLIYSSIFASDQQFFVKVLFSINNALQTHWLSCSSSTDHLLVDDRVLQMSEAQDSILRLNFTQMLPKSIIDKLSLQEQNKEGKLKGGGGKYPGKNGQGGEQDKQDLVQNYDKKHAIGD
jgi:hypothetical protein